MAVTLAILLTSHGPGRGSNPDEGGGLVIILGIIALVALLAFLAVRFLVPRLRGNRTTSPNEGETHDSGRAGRIL